MHGWGAHLPTRGTCPASASHKPMTWTSQNLPQRSSVHYTNMSLMRLHQTPSTPRRKMDQATEGWRRILIIKTSRFLGKKWIMGGRDTSLSCLPLDDDRDLFLKNRFPKRKYRARWLCLRLSFFFLRSSSLMPPPSRWVPVMILQMTTLRTVSSMI